MALSGPQFQQMQEALLDAFDEAGLRQLARIELESNLDAIAGGRDLTERTLHLVQWAERQGRVLDVAQGALRRNPGNQLLQRLADEAPNWPLTAKAPKQSIHSALTTPTNPDENSAAEIFLCYSRQDSALMQRVRAELQGGGFTVWTDESELTPGSASWQRAIEQTIQETQCMAALCTPAAKASEWVEIEVSYVLEIGRAVYPLLAGGDATSAIPLHLFNKQRVDIRSDLQALRSQLVPALHKHLGQRSALGPASPPIQNPKSQIQNLQPKIAFDWVLIPAGEFLMGSDKGKDKNAHDDELPQHKVYLPSYRMARVPVTVAQFRQFIEATGYKTTAEEEGSAWNWAAPRGAGSSVRHKSEHPVTCVSWHDAMKFCEWAGVRLPSEAEWERVARGVDGRIYPWGDEPPDQSRCNYAMNVQDTTAVGSYPKGATAEGLLDMAGNVWEWTSSLYKPYPYRAGDGREDAAASGRRLLRGGSFGVSEGYVRCASRFDDDPDFRDGDGGFRVVLPGSGSSEL